jgi:hypothetical protein
LTRTSKGAGPSDVREALCSGRIAAGSLGQ